jgi:hypothetical protein
VSGKARLVGLLAIAAQAGLANRAAAAPALTVEALSDLRVRGMSWSGGRATGRAFLDLPVAGGLGIEASAAALRGSNRHGDADAGFDVSGAWRGNQGPWSLSARATGHVFAGRSKLNYGEGAVRAAYLIGPASIGVSAAYAPRQRAIGGDNLYLSSDATLAIPGTPLTLDGAVGHSSGGRSDDPVARARSIRLRPGGDYWDYQVGVTLVRSPWTAGLHLSGTSIERNELPSSARYLDRHVGTRLVASASIDL